jgi:ABC-type branched-subunit amino acid transport system ATPase component
VIESATILGSLVLAGYEFSTNNAVHALSTMAIFLAASSRIAPSVLRIQQGILTVRNNLGSASQTIVMIDSFKDTVLESSSFSKIGFEYVGFKPILEVNNASFRYSKLSEFALDNVNLSIAPGSSAAIVGPSGAGKSTLVDLILGILRPDSGSIEISKVPSSRVSKIWPGAMAYVPQDVHLIRGSIRENVSLGYPLELASQQRVEKSLRVAQLLSTVEHLPNGFDTLIGEHGAELSGGQRQRLGIARALFTDPRFLVLDEATSALDGHTEAEFSEAIKELKGKVTVLIVAHRLSTIRNVDQVIYMQQGKVLATGSFEEVRSKVPDFDNQATGLGL